MIEPQFIQHHRSILRSFRMTNAIRVEVETAADKQQRRTTDLADSAQAQIRQGTGDTLNGIVSSAQAKRRAIYKNADDRLDSVRASTQGKVESIDVVLRAAKDFLVTVNMEGIWPDENQYDLANLDTNDAENQLVQCQQSAKLLFELFMDSALEYPAARRRRRNLVTGVIICLLFVVLIAGMSGAGNWVGLLILLVIAVWVLMNLR